MTDVDLMFKVLGLAWIPRLLTLEIKNDAPCQTIISENMGGLNCPLKCNYDTKYFPQLPAFYKNIQASD